jgi:hypothetical protein
MKVKAALIVDDLSLTEWQRRALEDASDYLDIQLVLDCRNTHSKKHLFKHFFYYVLNVAALRGDLTRRVKVDLGNVKTIAFDSIYKGMWQSIPAGVARAIEEQGIRLVVKFGMSLLRIDEGLANLDIISFHHGDPEYFRGRPAGFYELDQNANRIGIIVQKLSNTLDAGEVLIRVHSKIHHHSYRKTARNFYLNSRPLLRKAIISYLNGDRVKLEKLGPNYRLPGNFVVLKFLAKMVYRNISRAIYGAFIEKKWNIVKLGFSDVNALKNLSVSAGAVPKIADGYVFYADPFFSLDGRSIRVEAMNAKNGLGELVEITSGDFSFKSVLFSGAHYSYPYAFDERGEEYILPEVASHSAPYLAKMSGDAVERIALKGFEDKRLVDGTLIEQDGVYYLFGGYAASATDSLYLYTSAQMAGPYVPHPQNPIVIDPDSARMAGGIHRDDGRMYRFGQNNCFGYGSEITVSEIVALSKDAYVEKPIGKISFSDARGPHTLDICGNEAVLDFYVDRFSILAGYRRFVARLVARF